MLEDAGVTTTEDADTTADENVVAGKAEVESRPLSGSTLTKSCKGQRVCRTYRWGCQQGRDDITAIVYSALIVFAAGCYGTQEGCVCVLAVEGWKERDWGDFLALHDQIKADMAQELSGLLSGLETL